MFGEKLENIRKTSPLIHNITNYVTANDCANILLACGASPTMADDASEVEEITAISNALNINIGTLNAMVEGMFLAGKKANALGRPVVLDPVGAGADYLGVGAVFSTSTKLDADTVSLETLREICTAVKIPVVAIGGINEANLPELTGSGINGVAVVSAIFAAPSPGDAARRLSMLAQQAVQGVE